VDNTGDVGEEITRALREGLVGTVLRGVADELGHRLALDCGRSLNLLVELWVEAETSHTASVSRMMSPVLHAKGGSPERVPMTRVLVNQLALSIVATIALGNRNRIARAIRVIGRGRAAPVAFVVAAANAARMVGINNEVILVMSAAILLAPRSWRSDVWSIRNHPAVPRIVVIAVAPGVVVTGVPTPGGRTGLEVAAATAYDLLQTAVVISFVIGVVSGLRAIPYRVVRQARRAENEA